MFTNEEPSRVNQRWVAFPGGELEGRAPKVMCPACRQRAGRQGTLCFQCYRAELDRERRLKAASVFDGASEARFQSALPFQPVDVPRLNRLRAERSMARASAERSLTGQFELRLRRAQIEARKAVQGSPRSAEFYVAMHAAELQLPEAWIPFVAAR